METDEYFPSGDAATGLEPEEEEEIESEEILETCLKQFGSPDFIMEPEIFTQLKSYFQAGGNPEQVIDLLSRNYIAVAQMANLMAEWLILGIFSGFFNIASILRVTDVICACPWLSKVVLPKILLKSVLCHYMSFCRNSLDKEQVLLLD